RRPPPRRRIGGAPRAVRGGRFGGDADRRLRARADAGALPGVAGRAERAGRVHVPGRVRVLARPVRAARAARELSPPVITVPRRRRSGGARIPRSTPRLRAMRILVTGGAGMIGRKLAERL